MSELERLSDRRKGDGFNSGELLKNDAEWVACWTCRKKHKLRANNADHDYQDFALRHPTERGCIVMRLAPPALERTVRREERKKRRFYHALRDFAHNANILEAYQAAQNVDQTSLASLANSLTAGWCAAWLDNTVNLYLGYLYYFNLAMANTAAASQKAVYLFAAGSLASADLPTNSAGNNVTNSSSTSGLLTFLDVSANPTAFATVRVMPYLTTNKPVYGCFDIAPAFSGWIPPFTWLSLVNASGAALGSSSLVTKYRGIFLTAA
jgi:hypothetical protein